MRKKTPVDMAEIRKCGFLPQRQKNLFSLRLKAIGGNFTPEGLEAVARVVRLFGRGRVHLTSRQGMEIPFVRLRDVEAIKTTLRKNNLESARVGARVRTVTACQGSSICAHGWIDSGKIARLIDRKFDGAVIPHKFKIGVTGCANNCLKAEENDIGIKGAVTPEWNREQCVFCAACAAACPGKAIHVEKKSLKLDRESCLNCGICLKRCPKNAWGGKPGYKIYFGGVFGRRIRLGRDLLPVLPDAAALIRVIQATLSFYAANGRPKERFAFTMERVGWEPFTAELSRLGPPTSRPKNE